MKALILAIGDYRTPSTRYRIHQMFRELETRGIESKILSWQYGLSAKEQNERIDEGVFLLPDYDVLILHRVLLDKSAYKQLLQHSGKPIIFDFDDALYAVPSKTLFQNVAGQGMLEKSFAWTKHLARRLLLGNEQFARRKWLLDAALDRASFVVAGNRVLALYASRRTKRLCIIPTVVDTRCIPVKAHAATDAPVIGWMGTANNLYYLNQLRPVFERLRRRHDFILHVVSSRQLPWQEPWVEFTPWGIEGETSYLIRFDIGIMPLTNDEWSRGKCAFKAVYYSAAGLPVVASPVGANREVVLNGRTGYWASSTEEWMTYLENLLRDVNLRQRLGTAGRRWIDANYSLQKACSLWCSVLESCVEGEKSPVGVKNFR